MTPTQIAALATVSKLLEIHDLIPADLYGYHLALEAKEAGDDFDPDSEREYWYDCASTDFINQALTTVKELGE